MRLGRQCPVRLWQVWARPTSITSLPVVAAYEVFSRRCVNTKTTPYNAVARLIMGVKELPWKRTVGKAQENGVGEFKVEHKDGDVAQTVLKCHKKKEYKQVILILAKLKEDNRVISTAVLRELMQLDTNTNTKSFIEPSIDSRSFEPDLKAQVTAYHGIVKMYLPLMKESTEFQELAIRWCYHTGDVGALNELGDLYLKGDRMDPKTLCYVICGNADNYDVSTAKEKFTAITNQSSNLDVRVLETSLLSFIKAGALFEHLAAILQGWLFSRNPLPSARAMSAVLSQAHKYGTEEELREVQNLVHRYGLHTSYLVRIVELKNSITSRQKNTFKKEITAADLEEVADITNSVLETGTLEELTECYYQLMDFFMRYATVDSVKTILSMMKEHEIAIDDRFRGLLMQNYMRHEKYIQLVDFVRNTRQKFTPETLVLVFETLVRSHPYYAEEFRKRFISFINGAKLDDAIKEALVWHMRIRKKESSVRPYVFGDSLLNRKKYKSAKWNIVALKKSKTAAAKEQCSFRVSKGFDELIQRGVKPDMAVIEQTFRSGSLRIKTEILELAQTMRMQDKDQNRLSMINLQFATKDELRRFITYNGHTLNTNNKIALSRILCNKRMWDDSLRLLKSVPSSDVTDITRMVILNFKLLPLYLKRDYAGIQQELQSFPLDIALSSYIVQKMGQLKSKLVNYNITHSTEELQNCIDTADQFIGNCEKELQKQKETLHKSTDELFEHFNSLL